MKYSLSFYDPYCQTRLTGRKAFFFCAYHQFSIPHDTAAAILYGDLLQGLYDYRFDPDFLKEFNIKASSFLSDADWYTAALRSMGYDDIAEEYELIDEKARQFALQQREDGVFDDSLIKEKILSLIPEKYIRKKGSKVSQKEVKV